MKITIHTVSIEDRYGTFVKAFASKEAADNHVRDYIVERAEEIGLDPSEVRGLGGDDEDLWEAFEHVRREAEDVFHSDQNEVEIGNLAVVTEGGMPHLIATGTLVGQEYVAIDYDTDGADRSELFVIPQHDKPATEGFWRVFEVDAAYDELPISPDAEPAPVAAKQS